MTVSYPDEPIRTTNIPACLPCNLSIFCRLMPEGLARRAQRRAIRHNSWFWRIRSDRNREGRIWWSQAGDFLHEEMLEQSQYLIVFVEVMGHRLGTQLGTQAPLFHRRQDTLDSQTSLMEGHERTTHVVQEDVARATPQ